MAKFVSIEYQYYELCCMEDEETTEQIYDLRPWIARMQGVTLDGRLAEINGIKGRLENIDLVHDDEFYALNFMRLDEMSNTYIVREGEQAQHIDLEDDEYIGKNTVLLYDPRLNVAMVQCNRGSYGTVGIQSYINYFNAPNDICYLRPIYNELSVDNLNGSFLKLDVRFSNIRRFVAYNSRAFERVVETCNEVECLTAHIELGLGYTRGSELNAETIHSAIMDLRDPRNRESVSSAKVKFSDDQKSSIFDLFDNIDHDIIRYTIPVRGELGFGFMADKMAEKYNDVARARILSVLNRGN
ncbi:hypothetical protein H8S75_31720 [Hungatella sp. L12]|uniref:DUF4868 domain-containing protein n=1 Tax=Hungatella hominis TaxID=2763050 RepID=A0ABR7HH38_9FIRM|nr:DUF6731 family protein [Hungatella hominis]MBC5712472.1 hypothetical protein [Hungatella hominis]